jgi:hypothetical protein
MKINDKVTIIPSVTLTEAKLEDLIGREGNVVEICYRKDGTIRGAWVSLIGEPYQGEQEWYIPSNSFME